MIRSWRTGAGLPQNTVNAIVQTPDGYLWVGTRDGLARFDGVRFTVFGLPDGLQSVEIQTLYVDRGGTLWIGTSGGGLRRWLESRIENVTLPHQMAADDTVMALTEDADGRLWIGTLAGLSVWQNGGFVEMPELASIERVGIRALRCDRSGGMWIATLSHGLYEFRNHRLAENRGPPGNETILAYCLLEDKHGSFWVSVGNGTVLCRQGGEWSKYTETNGLPFVFITCLAQGVDGTLWACSLDDGLYCFQGGRFNPLRKEQGLSANDIRSLCSDREGNLWVGTRTGGLDRLSRGKLLSYGVAQGLTNDYTRSVAETADGTLWVATTGGGLYQGGPEGFKPILPYYSFAESVLAARDGSVWWGGARGLLCWNDGKLSASYTNETWVRSATVTALCEDRRGGFWVGTSEGRLVHFDDGKFVEWPGRASRGPITGLAQEANGNLWVGSMAGGLKRLRLGSDSILSVTNLPSQAVRTLYSDGEGSVWIGTAGAGLCHWLNGRVTTFTSRQGLGADTIVQIVEDDDGYLWLGCSRGILRVRKAALNELASGKTGFLHPHAFGLNDGMPVEECSSGFCPAGLKTKSGMICFSTVKGLVLLDSHRQESNAPPPSVLLEEVVVNGQMLTPKAGRVGKLNGRGASESGDSLHAREITIPPGGRELDLHYTGISFGAPEKLRFRYKLQGLDRDWVEAGERRTAYYHDLAPVSQLSDLGQSEAGSQPAARGQFERIGAQARAAVQALDEIVWATNPKNDNLPRFAEYVCHFADEFFEDTAVRCWQEVPTDLPNVPLRAELRHNLFLAVKEAFNNVRKHARATEVWLRLALADSRVRLEIEDNGRGFNEQQTGSRGNGLDNLKARLAECGGQAEIISQPGKGTRLRFDFPLRDAGG